MKPLKREFAHSSFVIKMVKNVKFISVFYQILVVQYVNKSNYKLLKT